MSVSMLSQTPAVGTISATSSAWHYFLRKADTRLGNLYVNLNNLHYLRIPRLLVEANAVAVASV